MSDQVKDGSDRLLRAQHDEMRAKRAGQRYEQLRQVEERAQRARRRAS